MAAGEERWLNDVVRLADKPRTLRAEAGRPAWYLRVARMLHRP